MDLEKVQNFLERYGTRGKKTIETLISIDDQYGLMFSNELLYSIIEEDLKTFETLLFKAAIEGLDENERAEFRYIKYRLDNIKRKMNYYVDTLKKIEA